jgi:hypothetical protein
MCALSTVGEIDARALGLSAVEQLRNDEERRRNSIFDFVIAITISRRD